MVTVEGDDEKTRFEIECAMNNDVITIDTMSEFFNFYITEYLGQVVC